MLESLRNGHVHFLQDVSDDVTQQQQDRRWPTSTSSSFHHDMVPYDPINDIVVND